MSDFPPHWGPVPLLDTIKLCVSEREKQSETEREKESESERERE